ncbi:MAG: FAD-dependent oxidoreductase [Gammaproteobacteria bacterium]|nr:FAD-dependent oxidoreductase [Gammaproteobacteria bacterium]
MPEPLPSLASHESCELLIVGGGFTGLWAALQAKERKPDADIILIERTFVGDGASGRCGGFIQHYLAHGES